jgi:hypothetical protein
MPIQKNVTMPNGATLAYHRAVTAKVDLIQGLALAVIYSYITEASYVAGNPIGWSEEAAVPLTALSGTPLATIENSLIAVATSPFYQGTILADNSTSVAAIQTRQWIAIKGERDRRTLGGYLIGSKWFHSDEMSRIQQIGLLNMGANIPAGLQWKTMDGTFVTMTQTLAGQIFNGAAASDQALFKKAETEKANMLAVPDPSKYDWSLNWPAIYG